MSEPYANSCVVRKCPTCKTNVGGCRCSLRPGKTQQVTYAPNDSECSKCHPELPEKWKKEREDMWKKLEEKSAESLNLVHYSKDSHPELRPLSYDELSVDRARGRWANEPDKVKQYVDKRKWFESALHSRLAKRGIPTDRNNSFLYATIDGHEQFGDGKDNYKHTAPLSDDIVNQSFFDVVGAGKGRTTFGHRGLQSALNRWRAASTAGALKPEEFMGMAIRPRIEVITPAKVVPTSISSGLKQAESSIGEFRPRVEVIPVNEAGEVYGGIWPRDGSFAVPGGGVEKGETAVEAALRELKEEAGLTASSAKILPIGPVLRTYGDEEAKKRAPFIGSSTRFAVAKVEGEPMKAEDPWKAESTGYKAVDDALAIMAKVQNKNEDCEARHQALKHVKDKMEHLVKQAGLLGRALTGMARGAAPVARTAGNALAGTARLGANLGEKAVQGTGNALAGVARVGANVGEKAVGGAGTYFKNLAGYGPLGNLQGTTKGIFRNTPHVSEYLPAGQVQWLGLGNAVQKLGPTAAKIPANPLQWFKKPVNIGMQALERSGPTGQAIANGTRLATNVLMTPKLQPALEAVSPWLARKVTPTLAYTGLGYTGYQAYNGAKAKLQQIGNEYGNVLSTLQGGNPQQAQAPDSKAVQLAQQVARSGQAAGNAIQHGIERFGGETANNAMQGAGQLKNDTINGVNQDTTSLAAETGKAVAAQAPSAMADVGKGLFTDNTIYGDQARRGLMTHIPESMAKSKLSLSPMNLMSNLVSTPFNDAATLALPSAVNAAYPSSDHLKSVATKAMTQPGYLDPRKSDLLRPLANLPAVRDSAHNAAQTAAARIRTTADQASQLASQFQGGQ